MSYKTFVQNKYRTPVTKGWMQLAADAGLSQIEVNDLSNMYASLPTDGVVYLAIPVDVPSSTDAYTRGYDLLGYASSEPIPHIAIADAIRERAIQSGKIQPGDVESVVISDGSTETWEEHIKRLSTLVVTSNDPDEIRAAIGTVFREAANTHDDNEFNSSTTARNIAIQMSWALRNNQAVSSRLLPHTLSPNAIYAFKTDT